MHMYAKAKAVWSLSSAILPRSSSSAVAIIKGVGLRRSAAEVCACLTGGDGSGPREGQARSGMRLAMVGGEGRRWGARQAGGGGARAQER